MFGGHGPLRQIGGGLERQHRSARTLHGMHLSWHRKRERPEACEQVCAVLTIPKAFQRGGDQGSLAVRRCLQESAVRQFDRHATKADRHPFGFIPGRGAIALIKRQPCQPVSRAKFGEHLNRRQPLRFDAGDQEINPLIGEGHADLR